MSDRSMSSVDTAERTLRQRFLDASAQVAAAVLPVFAPTLGTIDGEFGAQALTWQDLSAPIQTTMAPEQQTFLRQPNGMIFLAP